MPINAVILAAGEGTRMKSAHPKVMHQLLDKPLVWWSVRAARAAGCERIIVVVGSGAQEVRNYFAADADVEFVEQTERLGTGHAVRVVKDALGGFQGPVLVLAGDTPLVRAETLRELIATNRAGHNACTVLSMTPPNPTGYGRLIIQDHQVKGIVEHKDATPSQRKTLLECNSSIYCFCGGRLTQNIDELTNNNAQNEYYLTDMVGLYAEKGEPLAYVHADYEELLGVNSRAQLAVANKTMQKRINAELMDAGVSMLDPDQVWVGPEVEVGRDTVLLPQTYLWGTTQVGSDCVVGPNSRLTNAHVGSGCTVDETIIVDSTIDDNVSCGPRAYLRGGAHLHDRAKAGTHVEIKGSEVGEGSKVPHLSYIGDATLGKNVNIGGGSITCNYDGKHKSKTTIGDHVFIGSDTMMVAPVTIGDNALVGASSCITHDVPAGALALERTEQLIKEDWANTYWDKLEKED